ncbi:alpha/beta hydrolase [Amycolatopsis rubida]|uniref:Alpha/beta hydrolase n=1 Tax=Amycolatopsis rubida TaxID=112413 RepID=A0ABX0BQR1_9PSEU|nr:MULTISPECIES: alpha/beta hydrolase [Amycolatopsis]MYW92883.1 alpha/beta fold hydrolase [Amycolatopsis rubida]NEC57870.1 alpha/beta hydrolase [Amycolatopsis rubida]
MVTLAGGLLLGASAAVAPAGAAEPAATTCQNVAVPVTAAGQAATIAGTLCTPPGATTVQILVHGWSYARYYWDAPYEPDTYSYVRAANKRGYATLNIDRLGDGQSTRPLSAFDNFYADVSTVHQVITALRDGRLGTPFSKVIEVGHSLGGIVTMTEAGLYKDVDAIMPTAIAHSLNYVNVVSKIIADDYPAALDPKFAAAGLDPAYLTSYPGTRGGFYLGSPSSTDPGVVAKDEQLKDTGNLVELATLAGYNVLNVDRTLNIPVYTVVGQHDPFICGLLGPSCSDSKALADFERPFYGPQATVVADVVPNTAHDLQLEKSAPESNARMLDFADKYVGAGNAVRNTAPGAAAATAVPQAPAPSLAAKAVNATVVQAVVPAVALLQRASNVVPGIGDNKDPIPGMAQALSTIGNLTDSLVGTFPEGVIAGT